MSGKILHDDDMYLIDHANNSTWAIDPNHRSRVTGHFENASTNNGWPASHIPGETYDRGSNWTAFESSFGGPSFYVTNHQQRQGGAWWGYKGPVMVHNDNHFDEDDFIFGLDDGHSTEAQLLSLGSTAISRVLPTNPASDVPTALAELIREGIPGFGPGIHTGSYDGIGNPADFYLGSEFGLKPFFRELLAFTDAIRNAEAIINQYAKASGKLIRRRYEFPIWSETTEVVFDPDSGIIHLGELDNSQVDFFLLPWNGGYPGARTDYITRDKRAWFSGAFTYYLPEVGNTLSSQLEREYAEMRRLYGGISISTAWNLLPYSWAVDWYTNAGDILRNIEAFQQDGLVMAWGYIMERCDFHVTRVVRDARFSTWYTSDPYFTLPSFISSDFTKKYLRRRKATPYGFGLDPNGFTNRQKAILVSLGIQRVY